MERGEVLLNELEISGLVKNIFQSEHNHCVPEYTGRNLEIVSWN